ASSTRGEMSVSTLVGIPGMTRQRIRRSGSGVPRPGTSGRPPVSTRTRRVPSQPGAPVTSVSGFAKRQNVAAVFDKVKRPAYRMAPVDGMAARPRVFARVVFGSLLVGAGLAVGVGIAEIALRAFGVGGRATDL